ncbi:outer membrane beta-barrel family protein [Xanthovirga aplysinae]|uniref:outer membrane beta-barrel family protein n=1 Tax=Xanthovirga aplysinae TaxID=2529853 RepID=UPI00165753BD|nr:outer membrane beta-barrel family protein [Xanthovirga aplysinae]
MIGERNLFFWTLSFSFLLLFNTSFAQEHLENYTIQGKVQDVNEEILSGALIKLLQPSDSTIVQGVFSDENGNFKINHSKVGIYEVQISFVGNETFTKVLEIKAEKQNYDLGRVILSVKQMESIEISGLRQIVKKEVDRTIYAIAESPFSKGENGLSVFQIIPEISIQPGGELFYKGRQEVVVYVNDKRIPVISPTQLNSFLSSIPSETIVNIEIIPVPGPKYDVEGFATVVNINLKKKQKDGWEGGLNGDVFQNKYFSYNASAYLNYKYKAVQGHLRLYQEEPKIYTEHFFEQNLITDNTKWQNSASSHDFDKSQNLETVWEWDLGTRTKVGALYRLNRKDGELSFDRTNWFFAPGDKLDSATYMETVFWEDFLIQDVQFDFLHQLDTLGGKISASYNFVNFDAKEYQDFYVHDFTEKEEVGDLKEVFFYDFPSNFQLHSFRLDAYLPNVLGFRWEAGAKYNYMLSQNEFTYLNQVNNSKLRDPERSSDYDYKEDILGIYTSAAKKIENWDLKFGLRAEQTIRSGKSYNRLDADRSFYRNYWSLLPSVFLNYTINKDHNLGFSFKRSIVRPNYIQIAPVQRFNAPTFYDLGNPDLKGVIKNQLEFSYLLKNKYSFSLAYMHDQNSITKEKYLDEKRYLVTTFENLDYQNNLFFDFGIPITFIKWWDGNFSITFNSMGFRTFSGRLERKEFFNISSTHRVNLPKNYNLIISGIYYSGLVGQMNFYEAFSRINVSLKKSFLGEKLNITAYANDIFDTYIGRRTLKLETLVQTARNTYGAQQFGLKMSFNFSKGLKIKQRNIQEDTEKRRFVK